MPAPARDFQVVAVDQRGIGLTDKPKDGYDTGTLAGDLVALMEVLGHQRFAVVGHDTGLIISYALAADHPDRVDRLVLVEDPGPPGVAPAPPLFVPEPISNRLRHIPSTGSTGSKPAADDVQSVVIPGAGHWVAEEAPEELLAALTAFLAPYRVGVPA